VAFKVEIGQKTISSFSVSMRETVNSSWTVIAAYYIRVCYW